jgi:hypothetical protein
MKSNFDLVATAMVSFEKVRGRRPACTHVAAMTGISRHTVNNIMRFIRSSHNLANVKPTSAMMKAARQVKVLSEEEINAKKARGGVNAHGAGRKQKRQSEQERIEQVVRAAKEKEAASVDVMHDYRRRLPRLWHAVKIG